MHTPEQEAQDALVVQAQGGNEHAWAQLVELYKGPLWGYLARLTNVEIASDLVQDTLIKAWLGMCRQRLNQPRAFGPWLYRIATNTANDWLRRQRLERQYHTSWELREEQEDASDFINVVMQRDLVHKVLQLMPLMPRQCLILYDEQGFSYAEIAILLGGILKESSIRTYVSTARALFRSLYLSFKTSENSLESEGDPYGKM